MDTAHQNAPAGAPESGILPAAPDGRLHPLVGLRAVGSTSQAARLKAMMEKEHRNITSFAKHAGVCRGSIDRVMNGHGTLSLSSARKIAATYGGSYMDFHEDWKREVTQSKANVKNQAPNPPL